MTYAAVQSEISFDNNMSYFNDGFDHEHVITTVKAYSNTFNVDFDSFVCLGLSSSIVVPVLAYHFKMPFLALRKPNVSCHDSGIGRVGRGTLGKRWLFVDDFMSSGSTIRNAIDYVNNGLGMLGRSGDSIYAGTITYNRSGAYIDPDFKTHQLVKVTTDGSTLWFNSNIYNEVRRHFTTAYYADLKDPKGYAIRKFRNGGNADKVSLKDLSALVVFIAKECL